MHHCRTHFVVLLTHNTVVAKFKQGFSLFIKRKVQSYITFSQWQNIVFTLKQGELATENALSTATLWDFV